jgi:hypothetical protein
MSIGIAVRLFGLTALVVGSAFAETVVYGLASNVASGPTSNLVSFGTTGTNANLLVGSNIDIVSVTRTVPGPSLFRQCIGCVLNFTSGALSSYTKGGTFPNGYPMNPVWEFSSGGSASITGGVDLNDNGILDAGDIAAGSTLMSGHFLNSPTVTGTSTSDLTVAAGLILNSQNTTLNQFFFNQTLGLPTWQGTLSMTFLPFGLQPPTSTFFVRTFSSSEIHSGTLTNVVPEPSSIMLFSTILGGIGFAIARRRKNAGELKS